MKKFLIALMLLECGGEGEVVMETDGHDWYVWQNLLNE